MHSLIIDDGLCQKPCPISGIANVLNKCPRPLSDQRQKIAAHRGVEAVHRRHALAFRSLWWPIAIDELRAIMHRERQNSGPSNRMGRSGHGDR